MQRCPNCGGENGDAANFCMSCAAPLRASTDARPRQERKLVTVVFCDLVGFTGRAEVMDPEDVRTLLSGYHQQLRTALERFGGTVEKFIGDAVVAVFGAPAVHEDDAERAVRAALEIRDWAREQPDIQVRTAVNTGEALVSLGANPAEGMIAGDVINTASRMQSAAPVNGILVGEQTYRATRDTIEYAEHEPFAAAGKSQPVVAWEAVSARGRARSGLIPHERSVFVGRERELALLSDAFSRMRDDNEPQLVTLIGAPGAGKSRLVYELSRLVDDDPDLIYWRRGQCLAYGDGVAFWALAEIVKAECGILDSDTPAVTQTKLTEAVHVLMPSDDAEWVERDLRGLVGLADTDRHDAPQASSTYRGWQRFLEALAERGPTVLVVEDLHWADEGLLDFIDDFADACAGLPMLLVVTARPELLSRRPQWGGGKPNASTLSLPPLSDVQTAQIVQAMLAKSALPADLQTQLLERAGGNPLYAEEFARMLAEQGNRDLAIPESVQGIIAARLDGLEPDRKRLLQDASVIGSPFWLGAVASLGSAERGEVEAALRQLEQRDFIRRERRSSVEGEAEYGFRHLLVRDAAYGQIPRAERAERHRRTAEWISTLGRTEDHAELVAHHYLEALSYAKLAGQDVSSLAEAARAALREAGARALRLGAYVQATRYLEVALELTPDGAAERAELMYQYGLARVSIDSTGDEVLAEAVPLLRASDQWELAAHAAVKLARYAWARVDHATAEAWYDVVDELTADHPNSVARLESLVARSAVAMVGGDYVTAVQITTDVLPQLAGIGRPDLEARAHDVRGTSRCSLGDEGGLEDCDRAIEIARAGRATWELHHAFNNRMSALASLGKTKDFPALMEMWRGIFDEFGGEQYSRRWFVNQLGGISYQAGNWDKASDAFDEFLGGIPDGQTHYLEPVTLSERAMMRFAQGHEALALADIERAIKLGNSADDPQVRLPALCVHGRLSIDSGRADLAEVDWAELMSLREILPATIPQDLVAFSFLAVDLHHEAEATTIVDQCAPSAWLPIARAILTHDFAAAAELLDEIGRPVQAADARMRAGGEHLPAALRFYESVGATRHMRECLTRLDATA
ncbi:MAG TPA: AAA family ATPase [Jatrophihabitantaceae bacterium]|nr:AAA family ATPase [Jatrophihabitantaceae bacterium]